ncbi:thioredoxin family protein [Paucibacter sp. AS339]|uniref:thioredoxin family protein n=1 Tax=Paucibacter hankyongi TaxID=3133434 RepID=UPI00309E6FFE
MTSTPSTRFSTRLSFSRMAIAGSLAMVALLGSGIASAGEIRKADMEAYMQAATQNKPIIMHVHAAWCPVCSKQGPIIEELMKEPEFKDVIVFKIDFDADKPLVDQLGVKFQSTLIAAKGSTEVGRSAGATDKDKLRDFIRKAL